MHRDQLPLLLVVLHVNGTDVISASCVKLLANSACAV